MKVSDDCKKELSYDLEHYVEFEREPLSAISSLLTTLICDVHNDISRCSELELSILRAAWSIVDDAAKGITNLDRTLEIGQEQAAEDSQEEQWASRERDKMAREGY